MAIQSFLEGYKAFREEFHRDRANFFRALVDRGQNPDVMVIACSDSRVDPAIIGKAEPGEFFVVRNVANLVLPYGSNSIYDGTSSAIEFAVRDLEVKDIILLGHTHCGGIKRFCECDQKNKERVFVDNWMSNIENVNDGGLEGEERLRYVEKEAIKISLGNLITFPWLKERVHEGKLDLHGWLFDLEKCAILKYLAPDGWENL